MKTFPFSLAHNSDILEEKMQNRYKALMSHVDPNTEMIVLSGWDLHDFDFGYETYKRFPLLSKSKVAEFWQFADFSFSNLSHCNSNSFWCAGQWHTSYIYFYGCNFTMCNLQVANILKVRSSSFYEADLSFARIINTMVKECNFNHAIMTGIDLSGTLISDCSFCYAELENSIFSQAQINRCDWIGAKSVVYMNFDDRGYEFLAVKYGGNVMIKAGCRWYNKENALDHWGNNYYAEVRGQKYIDAITFAVKALMK